MDIWEKMYKKAKEQYHPEEVSPFIYAHNVVCAIEAENGEMLNYFTNQSDIKLSAFQYIDSFIIQSKFVYRKQMLFSIFSKTQKIVWCYSIKICKCDDCLVRDLFIIICFIISKRCSGYSGLLWQFLQRQTFFYSQIF